MLFVASQRGSLCRQMTFCLRVVNVLTSDMGVYFRPNKLMLFSAVCYNATMQ